MHENEMMSHILAIFPNASLGEDDEGQLVIYTDCILQRDGEIVPMPEYD